MTSRIPIGWLRLALPILFVTGSVWEASGQAQPGGGESRPSALGPGGRVDPGPGDVPGPRRDQPERLLDGRVPGRPPGAALPGTPLPEAVYQFVPGSSPVPRFTPDQIRGIEADIFQRAESIPDPLQRSQAFERYAQTKLRMRQLDDPQMRVQQLDQAHRTMLLAARSAQEAPQGLRRDLRLTQLVRTLLDLAAAQVVEGLSGSSLTMEDPAGLPAALEDDRLKRLSQAREEWELGFALAEGIENINYRCEQLNEVALAQSLGSQRIARSGFDRQQAALGSDIPRAELLEFADGLLRSAAAESAEVPRVVWKHHSLLNVASNAAESLQVTRARQVAESIQDPAVRAEALSRTGEALVVLASLIEGFAPQTLSTNWSQFVSVIGQASDTLERDLDLPNITLEEATLEFRRKESTLRTLLEAARALEQRVGLLTHLSHNARLARAMPESGALGQHPIRNGEEFEQQLDRLLPRLSRLKADIQGQLRATSQAAGTVVREARSRGDQKLRAEDDPYVRAARELPGREDPLWSELQGEISVLAELALRDARSTILPEATEVYSLAARAVASVPSDDPRNDVARVLIDSLSAVRRYDDARAAVRLLSRPDIRLSALGKIAEAQGRLGLAREAYAWIDREVAEGERAQLYRRVEAGALSSVDENYLRRALNVERR
jgi:hypothetical protein